MRAACIAAKYSCAKGILGAAGVEDSVYGLLHRCVHMDRLQGYLRMVMRENPKNLVYERTAHDLHALEIEHNISEAFDPIHDPFCLGAGNQLIAFIEREANGYQGFGETIGFLVGVFVEHGCQGPVRVRGYHHENQGSSEVCLGVVHYVDWGVVQMIEHQVPGMKDEVVEGPGCKKDPLAGVVVRVRGQLAFAEFENRLVPVDNSLIFINFMNRLRAKRTDSLTNRFFLLSIRPV